MKTVLALVLFVVIAALFASATAVYTHTDGKPNCTSKNVETGKFRNNWDPTRYWVCDQVGEEAKSVNCPGETGYMNSKMACVGWGEWEWEVPYDPPTE